MSSKDTYSNTELSEIKKKINKEMLRRGTYKWWGPLSQPKIGEDKSSPISIPDDKNAVSVTDKTYTINNPSTDAMHITRNIEFEAQGENPAGQDHVPYTTIPNKSSARFDLDEMRNYLIGMVKVKDINLFYSSNEDVYMSFNDIVNVDSNIKDHKHVPIIQNGQLGFRDLSGIRYTISSMENDKLNELTTKSCREDFNAPKKITVSEDVEVQKEIIENGYKKTITEIETKTTISDNPDRIIKYDIEDGKYIMPSGEYDGEEGTPSETNYYDDYGAEPGNGNYRGLNPYVSELVDRRGYDFDNDRNKVPVGRFEGERRSTRFGPTPRNPERGEQYQGRLVYQGVPSTCLNACTGLCSLTCDSQCSENCSTTCFGRCGNSCTSTCGNVCTGCSSLCYTSCQSKCENNAGMACVNAGATTVSITARGGKDGTPAYNEIKVGETYSCTQCTFSCQFYPNKKTTCWDNGCMGMCFTSCTHSCSTSCYGGCVDNPSQNTGDYKTGIGRGCSSGCTVNCIGVCRGTCAGSCSSSCWNSCIESCVDNCEWSCSTSCGSGCSTGCTSGCENECSSCVGSCTGLTTQINGCDNSCSAMCYQNCDGNCMANGCKSMCGTEGTDACDMNCRMSCMSANCSAMCSEQCVGYCSSCVNTCGFGCGACFIAGTLVETIDGPVPIEDIQIGDLVLTQSGRFCEVYNTSARLANSDETIIIPVIGAPPLYTTTNHPFWIKKYKRHSRHKNGIISHPILEDVTWIEAKDINARDKAMFKTMPAGNIDIDDGIAYLVGRWLGDGWRSDEVSWNGVAYPRFSICCGKHEIDDVIDKFNEIGIYYTYSESSTVYRFRISTATKDKTVPRDKLEKSKKLASILSSCGKGSNGKFISNEIYTWNEKSLRMLLQGYLDADGHKVEMFHNIHYTFTTVSKMLAYGMSRILRTLGYSPSWSVREVPEFGMIMSRRVHLNKQYIIRFIHGNTTKEFIHTDIRSEETWATVREPIRPGHEYIVYNLSVADDPTYYADGVLVHNCSSMCSVGCESACNITCSSECQHSCSLNCVKSCTEQCGGCSNLCMSCVGMCIGTCSVKCENGCSSCANNCGYWCDTKCSQTCFSNCDSMCINTCSGSCIGYITSKTESVLPGPERPPTSEGYKLPNPSNRIEERESFVILKDLTKIQENKIVKDWKDRLSKKSPYDTTPDTGICIKVVTNDNIEVIFTDIEPIEYTTKYSTLAGGVFNINNSNGNITVNETAVKNWINYGYINYDGREQNTPYDEDDQMSIIAVVLHTKNRPEITLDDISYIRPIGYVFYQPFILSNGDIVCIIQRLVNFMDLDYTKYPAGQKTSPPTITK